MILWEASECNNKVESSVVYTIYGQRLLNQDISDDTCLAFHRALSDREDIVSREFLLCNI